MHFCFVPDVGRVQETFVSTTADLVQDGLWVLILVVSWSLCLEVFGSDSSSGSVTGISGPGGGDDPLGSFGKENFGRPGMWKLKPGFLGVFQRTIPPCLPPQVLQPTRTGSTVLWPLWEVVMTVFCVQAVLVAFKVEKPGGDVVITVSEVAEVFFFFIPAKAMSAGGPA